MTTPAHTSIGFFIYNLPLPLWIKIPLLFLSHFILDIYNEYYYSKNEPVYYQYLFGSIEFLLGIGLFYILFVYQSIIPNMSILLYVVLLPNLVDIIESFYKGYYIIKNKQFSIHAISKVPAFWGCHYKGWFPFKWQSVKVYHLPKINLWVTLIIDILLVFYVGIFTYIFH